MNVYCLKETRKMCSNIKYNCFTHHQTRPSLQRIVTRLQLIWSKINVCSNNLSRDYWSSLELVSEWSPGTGAWYEYLNRPIIGPGLSSLRIPGQHLQCHGTDFVWFNTLDYIDKAEHFVCPDYEIKHHSTPTYIPNYVREKCDQHTKKLYIFGSDRSSVNANVRPFVRLFDENLSRALNLHLSLSGQSQVSLRSVPGQSQVSLRSQVVCSSICLMQTCLELSIFIFLSQVSLRSVSGQSQVSLSLLHR